MSSADGFHHTRINKPRPAPCLASPTLCPTDSRSDGTDPRIAESACPRPPPRLPFPPRLPRSPSHRPPPPPPSACESPKSEPADLASSFPIDLHNGQLVNDHNHVGPGHDIHIRPFVCQYQDCDKAFARKSDLQRHTKIHTNDRPFACSVFGCGKSFIQRSALTVHTRVHTGEKPHRCEACCKAFADSSSLARHRRIHTGKRPYECKITGCGRLFARRNTFLKHYKRQHPNLPPPSSNSAVRRNTHLAKQTLRHNPEAFYIPGQPGSDDQPQYFIPTSSTVGSPHAIAAPYPPKDATSLSGRFTGSHNPSQFIGRQYEFITYPHQQEQSSAGQTPVSIQASRSAGALQDAALQAPSPAGSNVSVRFRQHLAPNETGFPDSAQSADDNNPRPAQYSGSAFPVHTFRSHSVRRASNGGITQLQAIAPRSVPNSLYPPRSQHFQPSSLCHAIGGFTSAQLANTPPQRTHLYPSYFHPTSVASAAPTASQFGSSPGWESDSQEQTSPYSQIGSVSDESRALSPDPLVNIHSVPSFSFYPPSGPPTSMPYVAVDSHHFNPLTQGPPQFAVATHQPDRRMESAPPNLLRLHSLPAMSVATSWTDFEPYHYPDGYESATRIGSGRSEDTEQWEEFGVEMRSREASEVGEDQPRANTSTVPIGPPKLPCHWSAPIVHPAPPTPQTQRINHFSSSASSSSASSTLVSVSHDGQQPNTLPHISVFAQSAYPMARTPIDPHRGHPTPMTPMTPADFTCGQQVTRHLALGSHAKLTQPISHWFSLPYRDEHNITLMTPPQLARQEIGSVAAVGLGIAGVHFDDRSQGSVAEEDSQSTMVSVEGEEELESDFEMATADDSDDEFFPGAAKKKAKKRGGNAKDSGRRGTGKVIRK